MKLTRREARRYVREHWATLIEQADLQFTAPEGVEEIWGDECEKTATRIRGRAALEQETRP